MDGTTRASLSCRVEAREAECGTVWLIRERTEPHTHPLPLAVLEWQLGGASRDSGLAIASRLLLPFNTFPAYLGVYSVVYGHLLRRVDGGSASSVASVSTPAVDRGLAQARITMVG